MNPLPENPPPAPQPRGTRPDAETADAIVLIKNVPALRATHQVRLLAFKAAAAGKKLALVVPASCRFDPALEALSRALPGVIRREKLGAP